MIARIARISFLRLIAAFFCIVLALPAQAEQRVALVIGNAAYKNGAPLKNPVNDAKSMTSKLRSLGFEVVSRENASQKDIQRAIAEFGRKLSPNTVGLFYYSGHGLQARGKNFMVPVDAAIDAESDIALEAVDVDRVLDQMTQAGNGLNILILDACRNNPFERSFRSQGGGGLAQMDAPKGTLIAYATAPGKVASDGTGQNGLYTGELLKAMGAPGLAVEEVFKQVRANVARATNDQQIPWESSAMTGRFAFSGAPGSAFAQPQAPAVYTPPAQPVRINPDQQKIDNVRQRVEDAQRRADQMAEMARDAAKRGIAAAAQARNNTPNHFVNSYTDNSRYEGQGFFDGKWWVRHGYGVYYYTDGTLYQGQYQNNVKIGHGVSIQPNGDRFEGEFADRREGYGVYRYAAGGYNAGQYVADYPKGWGIAIGADGIQYIGQLAAPAGESLSIDGEGMRVSVDGKILEAGMFRKGSLTTPWQSN